MKMPRRGVSPHTPPIVFLHNRDANMHALVGVADAVDREHYTYVFPNAPFESRSTKARGRGGYSWADPDDVPASPAMGEPKATLCARGTRTRRLIAELLRNVTATLGAGRPPILAGFSQGAACALRFGLEEPDRISGIVALSGFMVGGLGAPSRRTGRARQAFIGHGVDDPVVPIECARECRAMLQHGEYDVTYREYPMKHELSLAEIRDLRRWLHRHYPPDLRPREGALNDSRQEPP